MADYINTFGQKIQYLSSDPDPVQEGQVWYNSTSNTLKYRGSNAATAWSSGGNLNTGRDQTAGAGSKGSGLAFGGGYPAVNNTEKYNGSSWTEVNNLNA